MRYGHGLYLMEEVIFRGQDAIQAAEQIAKAKIAPISLEEKFKERNQTKIIPTFILHQNITGIGKAVS